MPSPLAAVDLSVTLTDAAYKRRLKALQAALPGLANQVYQQARPVVLVFEGWDAAGKGGAIKRLTTALDPRGYVVHPIAAPAGDDQTRHYLYRFWRRLPPAGQIAIFDRSWYGRVLVERVEGFCDEAAWRRAYGEINQFERQLHAAGAVLCKFWLHISADEQLRRFEARAADAVKAWKLTPDDWRNREKRPQYEQAVDDMLRKTSTAAARWTVVAADDKHYARVKVLATVVKQLTRALG